MEKKTLAKDQAEKLSRELLFDAEPFVFHYLILILQRAQHDPLEKKKAWPGLGIMGCGLLWQMARLYS